MTPQRIQLSRRKGWRMPPDAVKVDRSTKWGNPFYGAASSDNPRGWAVLQFERQIDAFGGFYPVGRGLFLGHPLITVEMIRDELAGKHLACWCPLDQPCHADVLLDLANAPEEPA